MSRRGGGLGIGACRLRGILGGIFVKIPPKTSKNVLLEMRALLIRSVRGVLGRLGLWGGFLACSFAYMSVQKERVSGGCEMRAGGRREVSLSKGD